MKKVFFATLTVLLALHLDCAAQWSECFNYKGAWSQWSKTYGEISMYKDDSGIVLKTSGGLVYFKFQIDNYVPPTKAELRAHRKSDEWFTYTGTVEYSVNDTYPTAEAIAKASSFVMPDPRRDQTPTVQRRTRCTIRVAPYKKLPSCYNVYFDGIGVGIDISGLSFEGDGKKLIRPGRVVANIIQTIALFPIGVGSWWWLPIRDER